MTKSKRTFISKRKNEGFYKKAKKLDVRSRSYFKLEQINNKFSILENGMKILDLGCAPGGWLELIDSVLEDAQVIGIDLLPVEQQRKFSDKINILEDDFNNLDRYKLGQFDLVLSDMAPEFSGDSKLDRGRTHKMNIDILKFSDDNLKENKNLVFKTFGGEDLNRVRSEAKKRFKLVKEFKPVSSQSKSAEFYLVCLNKK